MWQENESIMWCSWVLPSDRGLLQTMQDILLLCNAIKVRIIYRLMEDAMLFKQFNMKKIELQCAKCSKEFLLA